MLERLSTISIISPATIIVTCISGLRVVVWSAYTCCWLSAPTWHGLLFRPIAAEDSNAAGLRSISLMAKVKTAIDGDTSPLFDMSSLLIYKLFTLTHMQCICSNFSFPLTSFPLARIWATVGKLAHNFSKYICETANLVPLHRWQRS